MTTNSTHRSHTVAKLAESFGPNHPNRFNETFLAPYQLSPRLTLFREDFGSERGDESIIEWTRRLVHYGLRRSRLKTI